MRLALVFHAKLNQQIIQKKRKEPTVITDISEKVIYQE